MLRNTRICDRCDNAVTISSRHRYCHDCRIEALNARVSRRSRREMTDDELAAAREREQRRRRAPRPENAILYNSIHRAIRARLKLDVDAGRCKCWRCGQPIVPATPWDLGHIDGTTRIAGPEHARCNRGTSKRERRLARELRAANQPS